VKVRLSRIGRIILFIWFLVLAFTVTFGTFLYTFTYNYVGLTGLLLQDNSVVNYGVVPLGNTFPYTTGSPTGGLVVWAQICYIILSVGAPITTLVLMGLIWYFPLYVESQRYFIVICECVWSWSNLDTFAIALLGSVSEIPLVASLFIRSLISVYFY
jgi:hypothetical protein